MRVIDPGHEYEVETYDNVGYRVPQYRRYMKRVGPNYPGNDGVPRAGTNCQEDLRVLIDRVRYLNGQHPCPENNAILDHLRQSLWLFELRAASQREESAAFLERVKEYVSPKGWTKSAFERPLCVEIIPTCPICGHILCSKHK